MGLDSEQIVAIDRHWLNARRPKEPTPEDQNEALIPYMAELVLWAPMYISYHKQVARVHHIATAATDLESTSTAIAWGLDVFHTRVAPSGTFDLLAADFNYVALIATVLGVIVATVVAATVANKRELQVKWA